MLSSSGAVADEDMLETKLAIAIDRRRVKVLAMNQLCSQPSEQQETYFSTHRRGIRMEKM